MIREARTFASIALAVPAFVCLAAALWLRATGDRRVASPEAAAIIDRGDALDGHYVPEADLLSPEGRALRSKAYRLIKVGLVLFALALLNQLTI